MNNFARAVRMALSQRGTLAAVLATSLLVSLFWGGGIGAVYPFFEVIFQGRSLPQWARDHAAKARQNIADIETEIARLRRAAEAAPGSAASSGALAARRAIDYQQARLGAEQRALAWAQAAEPWLARFLPDDPFQTLLALMGLLLGVTVLRNLCLTANMQLVERLGERAALNMRGAFFNQCLAMDLAEFGDNRSGALVSRINGDVQAVSSAITYLFGKSLREPLKMTACLAGAACVSWRLLLVSLVAAPLALGLMLLLGRALKRANRRMLEEFGQMTHRVLETFSGMPTVKAYTMEEHERRRFQETSRGMYRKRMRIALYDSLIHFNNEVLGVGVIAVAVLAGGYLVLNQETHLGFIPITERPLDFGALLTFYAFLVGVSDPARKLADFFNVVQRGSAAADRVFPLLDKQPTLRDAPDAAPLADARGDIVFENVCFHYRPEQPVLRDFNLRVRAGEKLAIVGPNGCGKSTLANLLLRFYDPTAGAIRLGFHDLRQVRLADLRSHVGWVAQQAVLFDDTIFNNIRYGSPGAGEAEVIAAAQQARAHEFIIEKSEGYQSMVGERGNRLSGGQRQRLVLARAILRNPDILILDEATSQVDARSEQLIHRALQEFARGRTTLMITHRASTLALADRVLVMEGGKIVDLGGHAELLQRCPFYQQLYQESLRESA